MRTKINRLYGSKFRMVLVVLAIFTVLAFIGKGILFVFRFAWTTGITPRVVVQLLFDTGADLAPIKDRVNIALLGIGGGNHDGADLTDTILILSFNQKKQSLGMISVPRDIWSDTLKDKINSAYHYGEEKRKGGGLVLAKAVVSDMVGLPIQYGIVFDFTKFTRIINLVGGVSINVPQAFTDTEYPIAGNENDTCGGDPTFACRYETIHFDQGVQTMNGERALTYVRSRHAEGADGSDFARSRRQQEVLVALKDKLTSAAVVYNPVKLHELYVAFDDATDTDMNIAELTTVGKLFVRVPLSRVMRISIENELYEPPVGWYGRYVLLPRESFEQIHDYVNRSLEGKP